MADVKAPKTAGGAGKFSNPATPDRTAVMRPMFVCVIVCLVIWAGIYTAHATGDMSARLALGMAAAVLAVGSFRAGAWFNHNFRKAG